MCGNSVNENNDTAKGIEEMHKKIDAIFGRSPNEIAIRRILDDLRERHARELETWYRRLAEIEMSKQRAYYIPVRSGRGAAGEPVPVDTSKVICPECSHQFGAICVDDQKTRNDLERQVEAYKKEFHAMRGDYRRRTSEHMQEIERLNKELTTARLRFSEMFSIITDLLKDSTIVTRLTQEQTERIDRQLAKGV